MKINSVGRSQTGGLVFGVLVSLASVSLAGPIYDPYLEEFQVGAYLDPQAIEMADIWPGGLLTPPIVDTNWTVAARELLENPEDYAQTLTYRFLSHLEAKPYGGPSAMARQVAELESRQLPGSSPGSGYLFPERWKLAVFKQLETGRTAEALRLLEEGLASGHTDLSDREHFVWNLRRHYLAQLETGKQQALESPWPESTRLGPYDSGTVWALWVAHRQAAGLPLLPEGFQGKDQASRLAGLRKSYLEAADLEGSSFSDELKAGLGATLFAKAELAAHLKKYPEPPTDFTTQGWWIKGQRFLKRGNAPHYEALAARMDLKPGWRMDLWRRASELRLLKGQWTEGLADLDRALALAKADAGTRSLRRRLRHWVEQAAVLALAQKKEETAWRLIDQGDDTFTGEAGEVFREETRHWRFLRQGAPGDGGDWLESLDLKVESGRAQPLVAATGQKDAAHQTPLVRATESSLWDLWFTWGVALADQAPPEGPIKDRAVAYSAVLLEGQGLTEIAAQENAALKAVAMRFEGQSKILEPFIDKLVDGDVGRLADWRTVPLPSPIPDLLPILRRSQLDMHAAMGLALASGDMRGIVGLGFEIPGTGLTRQEKRRFLYPLPAAGPILDALLAADSEPALILAVARNESLFEPAVRSRAGALGWMQIMPFHFSNRGAFPGADNWAVPGISMALGDQLLSEGRIRYAGDPYLTLAAYNAGPGAAARWKDQLGGSPSPDIYLAWIGYPETRNYVEKVLIDREIYDWILAGRPGQ